MVTGFGIFGGFPDSGTAYFHIWISYTLQTNCKREILSGPTSKSPHARLFCNLILRLHLTDDRLREIDILLKLGYIPFAMHCLAFAETHSI
jgi:hypothetical protein